MTHEMLVKDTTRTKRDIVMKFVGKSKKTRQKSQKRGSWKTKNSIKIGKEENITNLVKYLPNSIFRMVLIENQKRFIDAGKAIVKAAGGKLIVTDPNKMKDHILIDFLQGFREILAS